MKKKVFLAEEVKARLLILGAFTVEKAVFSH